MYMTSSLYETAYFSVLLLASACIPSDAHDVDQPPRVCWPFILFSGGFCPPLPQCGIVIGLQIALYILRMYKIYQNSVSEFSLIDLFRVILSLRNTLNALKLEILNCEIFGFISHLLSCGGGLLTREFVNVYSF